MIIGPPWRGITRPARLGVRRLIPEDKSHTARYCLALANPSAATGDEEAHREAISSFKAVTYMQSPEGLFRTYFQKLNERRPNAKRLNWYSQHLYTVCHVLEAMPLLKELSASKK